LLKKLRRRSRKTTLRLSAWSRFALKSTIIEVFGLRVVPVTRTADFIAIVGPWKKYLRETDYIVATANAVSTVENML
jgi:hypothetical protein